MRWVIEQLHCRVNDRTLLDNFNAEFDFSAPIAIIGASGAGKSISIQCALGLFPFQKGRITFHAHGEAIELSPDSPAHLWTQLRKDIMFVPQFPNLFDDFNVQNNLLFPFRKRTQAKAVLESEHFKLRVEELGLQPLLQQFPTSLTPGQRKRVAIGRALLQNPKVLMLDEPTTDLDPASRQQMTELLADLQNKGQGMGLITHDQQLLNAMTLKIKVIQMGQIIWEGSVNDYKIRESSLC